MSGGETSAIWCFSTEQYGFFGWNDYCPMSEEEIQSFAKIRVRKMKGCEQMDNIQNENFYNKVIELFQNAKKNYQLQ